MVGITLIDIIIILISAILGIQVAQESVLALWIKQRLMLIQPYSKTLKAFSKFKAWHSLLGTAYYLLLPLILIVVLVLECHAFFSELLDCSYCSSTWIAAFSLYFILNKSILESLYFAPLAILGVYIINVIRKYGN